MKELEPDILRLIVDQAVGDINTKDPGEKAKQQELLAKFMQVKVSRRIQVLHTTAHQEVYQPQLKVYCTVHDSHVFLLSIRFFTPSAHPCSTDTARLKTR